MSDNDADPTVVDIVKKNVAPLPEGLEKRFNVAHLRLCLQCENGVQRLFLLSQEPIVLLHEWE